MTRYTEIQTAFDHDGDLDRDEIRWLLGVAKEAVALVAEPCLCSQTQKDLAPLRRAMVCNCGVCRECYKAEESAHEARQGSLAARYVKPELVAKATEIPPMFPTEDDSFTDPLNEGAQG